MYGSQVYGGAAYCNIDELVSAVTGGPAGGGGTTPSGARVAPARSTIQRPPRRLPQRTQARVEPAYGQAVLTPEVFANEWMHGLLHGQHFKLRLTESYVHTVWPVAAVAEDLMYFKDNVAITGTEDSPETLTTNVGKLALMENGQSWPVFNDATYVFNVSAEGRQEARVKVVKGSISEVGGNLQFQVAIQNTGNPHPADSLFYAKITVTLQAL